MRVGAMMNGYGWVDALGWRGVGGIGSGVSGVGIV